MKTGKTTAAEAAAKAWAHEGGPLPVLVIRPANEKILERIGVDLCEHHVGGVTSTLSPLLFHLYFFTSTFAPLLLHPMQEVKCWVISCHLRTAISTSARSTWWPRTRFAF